MHQRRFQILAWLLISWQLFVPSGAPWVHTLLDENCCANKCGEFNAPDPAGKHAHSHTGCLHLHGTHSRSHAQSDGDSDPTGQEPHDCSNCPVCLAIAAPRLLTALVSMPIQVDQIEVLPVAECADPQLGFGLPPQCRAPPAV
jgi:hypothetical protein